MQVYVGLHETAKCWADALSRRGSFSVRCGGSLLEPPVLRQDLRVFGLPELLRCLRQLDSAPAPLQLLPPDLGRTGVALDALESGL